MPICKEQSCSRTLLRQKAGQNNETSFCPADIKSIFYKNARSDPLFYFYSYRSASIGSAFAAFDAGYSPNKIPTTAENETANLTTDGLITTGMPKAIPPRLTRLTARATPKAPPQADNRADSVRN